jgi:serine/threonine protein kinase
MRRNLDLLINIFMFATIRNVLVGDNNVVKIADFGLARLIKVGSDPAVGWKAT